MSPVALDRPVLIAQILCRGLPWLSFCCGERVNLLLTVCFVVELGSKALVKISWCDPGCGGHCPSDEPWLS